MNAGNFEGAIAGFESTIEQAVTLGAEGDEMKAKAEAQIPPLYYRVAMDKYKAKDLPGAIISFEETIAACDQYGNDDIKGKSLKYIPQLHNAVGNSQIKSGDLDAALASFDKAIEYQPDYARAIYGKGMVYRKQKDDVQMVSTLEKAIEIGTAKGDEKTVAAATKTLKDHFMNNGKLAFKAEDYETALVNFESSFKYDSENAEPYYLMCVIYGKQENFEKAIEYGVNAAKFEVDDVDKQARIHYELGNAYMAVVDYDKACASFTKALVEPYTNTVKHKMENVLICK